METRFRQFRSVATPLTTTTTFCSIETINRILMSGTTARSRFQAPPSPTSAGGPLPARAESPPLKTQAASVGESFDVDVKLTMPLISLLLTLRMHIRNYLYWCVPAP